MVLPDNAACAGAVALPGSDKIEAWAAGMPAAHEAAWVTGRPRGCVGA